jgi:hypothetical protein
MSYRTPKDARGQTAKRLKLKMPWDDWFDLSSEERAQEESAFLDYLETIYRGEDFRGVIAMFESRYKDAIRAWHEEKTRQRRSHGS